MASIVSMVEYKTSGILHGSYCDGQPVCRVDRVACRYINLEDNNEDTLLFDKFKQCGINTS